MAVNHTGVPGSARAPKGPLVNINIHVNSRKRIKVLLASHESIHSAFEPIFRHSNWLLRHVQTCYEAIAFAKGNDIAVVICERDLPDGDWTTVFAE